MPETPTPLIILVGATGALGQLIGQAVLARGGRLRALVRPETDPARTQALRDAGAEVREVDFARVKAISEACRGGSCVVSALSGLSEVIIELQWRVLEGAVTAFVPRFIPSDYSLDFTRLPRGTNRNLDLRKRFHGILDEMPIAATSILNGMFTDLLNSQAPMVVQKFRRVVYWGSADQELDFTTMADTANYTAAAAMDDQAPRYLHIAGDVLTPRGLRQAASAAFRQDFKLFRAGSVGTLTRMIDVTRLVSPQPTEVFPPWQGMQYMRNMFSGRGKLLELDNDRYPDLRWTSVETVLSDAAAAAAAAVPT